MPEPRILPCMALLATLFLHCGNDATKNGGLLPDPPGSSSSALGLRADLNGRYARTVRIQQDNWSAVDAGQDIALTFAATGMNSVKQFELRLRIDPATALDLDAASFEPVQPFITFGTGIEKMEADEVRIGAANFQGTSQGDATLGTLRLKTRSGFDRNTRVRIQVVLFSIGPSFTDRDDYRADDLDMGLVINAR